MIARIWRGYTRPEHADAYESMLKPELLPGIVAQPLLAVLTICAACMCTGRSACATKMPHERQAEPPL